MRPHLLRLLLLGSLASCAHGSMIFTSDHPPGSPLLMSAGSQSGPMLFRIASDATPPDLMAAWSVSLVLLPEPGATGLLEFAAPASGYLPAAASYVFGNQGLGVAVTNLGTQLMANDFLDPGFGLGVAVPGGPGIGLLRTTFTASASAVGLFGIYAVRGAASTEWTDAGLTTRFFDNVPSGTGRVLVGQVLIEGVIPEPSAMLLFGVGTVVLLALRRRGRATPGR
jgi:hypothetical protein